MKDTLNINEIALSHTTYRSVVEVLQEAGINVSYDEKQLRYKESELDFAERDHFSEKPCNIVKFDNGTDYEIIAKSDFTPRIDRNMQQQNEPVNEQADMANEQPSKWSRVVRKVKCFFKATKLPRETRREIRENRLDQIELEYRIHQATQNNDMLDEQ